MTAYYNEIDPFAAAWLRELIKAGAIAPGDVDERSIEDVRPSDLAGYTQCHFFAGIGVWSYALRRAGWRDDRPVWTGSCPCQPFSAAGKGGGFSDERHLWPAFHWLIEQCRPPVVLGEQVASKDGLAWLDLVQADLEGTGYASRAVDICAAGVGAPHIRQRLWWVGERVADADVGGQRMVGGGSAALQHRPPRDARIGFGGGGGYGGLADTADAGCVGRWTGEAGDGRDAPRIEPERLRVTVRLADTDGRDASAERQQRGGEQRQQPEDGRVGRLGYAHGQHEAAFAGVHGRAVATPARGGDRPGPTNGHWRDADWLFCRDGKWRPVEPGTFPLAHGAPARVGRLRGYGNAINAEAAVAFIEAYLGYDEADFARPFSCK